MATDAEIRTALKQLTDYYAPKDMTPARLAIYRQQLARLDSGALERAVAKCLTTLTWFPKLNELFKIADEVRYVYEPVTSEGNRYWKTMSLYSAYYRGIITDDELESTWYWRWFNSKNKPVESDDDYTDTWEYTPEELRVIKANDEADIKYAAQTEQAFRKKREQAQLVRIEAFGG